MLSALTRWLSLRGYGLVTSTLFGATTAPLKMRDRFERLGRVSRQKIQRRFPKVVFGDHAAGDIAIESVCAVDSPTRVILYLHGGAYFMGSPASFRNRAMRLSYRCQAEVYVPDYRLAPEHPYPAALDDALAAWKLVRSLRANAPIFVAGESYGGNRVANMARKLQESHGVGQNGAILISPADRKSVV